MLLKRDTAFHAGRRDWVDVDKLNENDPQACSAYSVAICQHLRESELVKRASSRYLDKVQMDVNAKMRAILVDWLVEVSEEYKLCADTLYQAVNYIDRFLSIEVVKRSQLQLVGVTCMWIASKYEEIYPPNVADFCYITDNTCTKMQLVHMEEVILKRLRYDLTVPTAKTFLRRLLQVCNPDELLHFLSNYLVELSLLDYGMLKFLPSVIAASGVYLANVMLKRTAWSANLRHYSTYMPPEIATCVMALAAVHQAVSNSPNLAALREKYSHTRFQKISAMPPMSASTLRAVLTEHGAVFGSDHARCMSSGSVNSGVRPSTGSDRLKLARGLAPHNRDHVRGHAGQSVIVQGQ
mmetsp:Transcript_42834/g.128583  ORF Transcript_42834/g.128583 Transcript_42834/m.128583 type:complete len:352 (-) Transcript_42834:465-1520(-)